MRPNWFVGLPVSPGTWLGPLLAEAPADLKRIHPDDLHLSVAFLGDVSEEAARRAWAIAEAYHHAPLSVRLSGLAPMGNPRRPTALSVLLSDGHDEVCALIAALRGPMARAAGTREDDRPPKPHITVARPPRKAPGEARRQAVRWAESHAPLDVPLTLSDIALYTWSAERNERKFQIAVQRSMMGGVR